MKAFSLPHLWPGIKTLALAQGQLLHVMPSHLHSHAGHHFLLFWQDRRPLTLSQVGFLSKAVVDQTPKNFLLPFPQCQVLHSSVQVLVLTKIAVSWISCQIHPRKIHSAKVICFLFLFINVPFATLKVVSQYLVVCHAEADVGKLFMMADTSLCYGQVAGGSERRALEVKKGGSTIFRTPGIHSRRNHTIGLGELEQLDLMVTESIIRWASCTCLPTATSLRSSLVC